MTNPILIADVGAGSSEDSISASGETSASVVGLANEQRWMFRQLYEKSGVAGIAKLRDDKDSQILKQVIAHLTTGANLRIGRISPHPRILDSLHETFPNFSEVLDRMAESLALSHAAGTEVRLPNILLDGPPGVGKTAFAQALARCLSLQFHQRDLSVTSEAFVLAGMDSTWAGAKPGVVFETLVFEDDINPLILIDEVDKASRVMETRNSAMNALYQILERHSARRFRDEFFPLAIDASRINWVLAANETWNIPEAILSRVESYSVKPPTASQAARVADSVWSGLRTDLDGAERFGETLPDEVRTRLTAMTPRQMRLALERACGMAARNGSWVLEANHVSAVGRPAERRRVGFNS